MSLGTLGWGHASLAKKLGGEARKGGCGKAEIRWGPHNKSNSGSVLVLGLGRGLGPEIQWHWSGKGVRKENEEEKC